MSALSARVVRSGVGSNPAKFGRARVQPILVVLPWSRCGPSGGDSGQDEARVLHGGLITDPLIPPAITMRVRESF
ncbi:MAG TPA: hypothetical protein VGK23_04500 [Methanomassiliicoccales archaeon]